MMSKLTRYRWLCFIALGVMVALGISKTIYKGWGYPGLFDMVGDILYEMAWIWFVGAWKVRWPVKGIAIATFLITAAIEISQLIPFPQTWISQLWWRLLLGTHFAWPDFIYYAIGSLVGGLSLSWLRHRCGIHHYAQQQPLISAPDIN